MKMSLEANYSVLSFQIGKVEQEVDKLKKLLKNLEEQSKNYITILIEELDK